MSDARPTVAALGQGAFRVPRDGGSTLAWAVTAPEGTWVWLDGCAYLVAEADSSGAPRPRPDDDERALMAPMPATVRTIAVEAGQAVKAGDVLLRLEAMKMEMPVAAPRDGVVRQVNCRVGELVQPGVRLVDIG